MHSPHFHRLAAPVLLLLLQLQLHPLFTTASSSPIDHTHDSDKTLFHFVTRPDLKAPRWNIQISPSSSSREEGLTPGYWFLAPFSHLDQISPANGWVGPHIYDNSGELVWSGVGVSRGWDVLDFRRSFVKQEKKEKRGEEEGEGKGKGEGAFLTFLVQKTGEAVVLDEMYQVRERRKVGKGGGNFNSHELHFLGDGDDGDDDGTKVVVMHETHRTVPSEEIRGLSSSSMNETTSPCKVQWDGFRVLNTLTWETIFEWNSYNHVKLTESTFLDGGIESLCSNPWPWDAMHMNAVDMNPHGDYYLSARHTDTIYKISGRDGRVIWRLNGRDSLWNDFVMGEDFTTGGSLRFSRQHHVRWRGENGTHEFISILDNAKGTDMQPATGENSRAIVLALHTAGENSSSSSSSSKMTASLISSINHPNGKGSYAPRRGNYQFLGTQQLSNNSSSSSSSSSSSNSWISWSEEALHTEHFPNGSIALQASLHANWLGTYRSYKFPWRGIPKEKPVVHSVGYLGGGGKKKKERNGHHYHHHYHNDNNSSSSSPSSTNTTTSTSTTTTTTTIIHVSQNGATEISHWKLYKTIPSGNFRLFLCERPRQGFETQLAWKGFASYVIVEAVDFEGKVLATSEVVETKKLIGKDDGDGDGDDDEMDEEGLVMSGEVAEEVWWVQEKEREEREGEEERRKGEEEKSLGKGERNEGSGWWWWLSGALSMVSDEADSTSTKQQEQQQLQLLAAGRRDCVFAFAGGILVAAMLVCVFGVIRLRRGRQRQVQFYQALGKDEDEDEE
ncbi:uncharacterized protein SEPMUDRAFT_153714 [Sphaerulina musiva SO2202]|uniref:ASST-domain-containing protein n=1 Tax=Sphaerulina musiva (strain SO2202) TaxID=692275 RepID=N1QNM1_SPHMS|nr:uncharacterized protein SEPMUDRAFT_153714 [Sphaerulina musiva SO2202]EMF17878.1 hypothetical protein SEPMUDRAFT_153714 [Sphaerulina musiva SO2202]